MLLKSHSIRQVGRWQLFTSQHCYTMRQQQPRFVLISLYSGIPLYTLSNKNPLAWNFLSPELEVTWHTVAIIIRVILLSPYLRIRGVSLSSIHGWKRRVGNYQKLKTLNLKPWTASVKTLYWKHKWTEETYANPGTSCPNVNLDC